MEDILFNKNHIKVTCSNIKEEKWRIDWYNSVGNSETIYPKGMTITTEKEKYETVVRESPLGFYYKSVEAVKYEEEAKVGVKVNYHSIIIYTYHTEYRIKYPVSCNDVKIGFDARPWDIVIGDKSMPEHFIKALQKVLDEIFVRATPIKHWERTKEKMYTELFGNPKGYTTLDNNIKIVSHGFDPKESFRKRKIVSAKTKRKSKNKENEALETICSNIQ
jgi:hypothetical protein